MKIPLFLLAAVLLGACAGEAPPMDADPPPFYTKDSPEIRRIAEEAVAAHREHDRASDALSRAAPGEFATYRQSSKDLNRSVPVFLESTREHDARRAKEIRQVRNEHSAEEAAAFGAAARVARDAMAQAAPEEYEAYERHRAVITAGMTDLEPLVPAYEALMALQRAAPGEFRDYRDSSERRKAQVHAIIGGYRMHRAFTAHVRAREALVAAAPEEYEAWAAAGEALEKYRDLTIYVPEEEY